MPISAWACPLLALAFFAAATVMGLGGTFVATGAGVAFAALLIPILLGAVFAAVYHAEVIAHRTGEPYGTLILTIAVTVIEVALITSILLSDGGGSATIARDTVFAVVMIVCAGLVGLCIFVGGWHHREQSFRVTGAAAYLAVLMSMCVLTLVLPNTTQSTPGPLYSTSQLAFVSAVTIALYGVFLYIQTVRHRDDFMMSVARKTASPSHAHPRPSNSSVALSGVLLLVSLAGVIALAKKFAAVAEAATTALDAPEAAVGVMVALLILLPEGVAAVQAARRDELQKSINLALGSSLATIGLTIPAVAVLSIVRGHDLVLGLDPKDTLLLFLVLGVSLLTFGTGRTNMLFGFVHLVIFATFMFLTFVP